MCAQGGTGTEAIVIADNPWRNATVTTTTTVTEVLRIEAIDLRILINHVPRLRERVQAIVDSRRRQSRR